MKNLLKALHKFQSVCPPIKKDSANPFFKSSYASLDAIQNHIALHLNKCNLVVTQSNVVHDGGVFVETSVWEVESGERQTSLFPVVVGKQTAQDYGSAVSYAKRYSLSGLLNLIIEDQDDDGNTASGNKTEDLPWLNETSEEFKKVKEAITKGFTLDQVRTKYKLSKKVADLLTK